MALKICEQADFNTAYSLDGEFSNPMQLTFDGSQGGITLKKVYLYNDSATEYYTNIVITPTDGDNNSLIDGTYGYVWKLLAQDNVPSEVQWEELAVANSIDMDDIMNNSTYLPIWIRIEVASNLPVYSSQDVSLNIAATENLVP